MSKKDFDNFINKQAEVKATEKLIDWNVQRDEWLEYLSQFYNKVENFLAEYLTTGKVICNYLEIKMFEEYIGSYSARVLNIGSSGELVPGTQGGFQSRLLPRSVKGNR